MNRPYGCTLGMILLLCGCRVHEPLELDKPTVCIPEEYENFQEGVERVDEWWKEFKMPQLDQVVDTALYNNLDLRQTWWQLAQRCYETRIEGAERWPDLNVTANITRTKINGFPFRDSVFSGGDGVTTTTGSIFTTSSTTYLLANALSYEVDLWRRIDSNIKSACLEWQATREDLDATALTLTGTVVELWFTIQEQLALLELIDKQIEVSRQLLELLELRFAVGGGSALDVYQQRLQSASTEAERPPVASQLETSVNQLYVLLGEPPQKFTDGAIYGTFVELPPFPELRSPADLLVTRPDLRAEHRRLMAADYEVAAAIADRFPKLSLFLDYDFRSSDLKDIFQNTIFSFGGDLLTPIIDGGRRRAEVGKRKAVVCEILARYGQKFLDALREIEDAVVQERHQLDLISHVKKEISIAERNLSEAQYHYINGLDDYLTVIAAIQSLQGLQRQLISENRGLLVNRARLYRTLGGSFFD